MEVVRLSRQKTEVEPGRDALTHRKAKAKSQLGGSTPPTHHGIQGKARGRAQEPREGQGPRSPGKARDPGDPREGQGPRNPGKARGKAQEPREARDPGDPRRPPLAIGSKGRLSHWGRSQSPD
jgi:hypothetical protein